MNKLILLILTLILCQSIYAFQLNGTMTDNNDGTYEVTLTSNAEENPDTYFGNAVKQADGTLYITVAVEGRGSDIYIGIGTKNQNGSFDLVLKDNETGHIATGVLSE